MKRSPAFLIALLVASGHASLAADDPSRALARDILRQLIEIDTTDERGDTTPAARAMAARLLEAGFEAADVQVLAAEPRHGNLVARLRGTGARKPILLLAHLDVVDAKREDWSVDPFRFLERDGYYYGRGTTDIKDGDAILVANLVRLKREGFRPDRDLILALTAGEEGGDWNGVRWLLAQHRDLVDAAYCVNTDGGDFQGKDGRRRLAAMQASEKLSVHFRLEVTDPGGHSSLPRRDNPIYHLAAALSRLAAHEFPGELNVVTRAFFERMAPIEGGSLGADMKAVAAIPPDPKALARLSVSPYYNALLRTTCVATRLDGGHANNALPQTARATVNCRLLPGHAPEETQRALAGIVADPRIQVSRVGGRAAADNDRVAPPSTVEPELLSAFEAVAPTMWPGFRWSRPWRRAAPTGTSCGPPAFPPSGSPGCSSTSTTCGPTGTTSGWASRRSTRASSSTTG